MDKGKLEEVMSLRGISKSQLCRDLNMSRSAFYRKCNGKSEFTLAEIRAITDYLDLDTPMGIFFPVKVS